MKIPDDFIDFTLTPQNAEEKGFLYLEDIIIPTKNDTNTGAYLTLLAIHRFKIGIPKKINNQQYGLYVPESELKYLSKLSKRINNLK